jgi:hypothetical protein
MQRQENLGIFLAQKAQKEYFLLLNYLKITDSAQKLRQEIQKRRQK